MTAGAWTLTYVRVKGKWRYLYRAEASPGAPPDFLLSAQQDAVAAKRFLAKALGGANHPAPRVINTDGHAAYPPAVAQLKGEGDLAEDCRHRPVPYLNNVLEQDHRAIKRRVNASQHFSVILCRSAYARWLRGDPYDPQRPGLCKCVGTGHRFAPSLYSRSVRCDELNSRSSTSTFGSTAKLQHIHPNGGWTSPNGNRAKSLLG